MRWYEVKFIMWDRSEPFFFCKQPRKQLSFNQCSQRVPAMVWQPWVSASPLWITAGPHTGATISFLSKSSGLQSRHNTKAKPAVLVYWFGSAPAILQVFNKKSKRQLRMDMREECTYIGKRRKKRSKTKAVKTVAWFCLASTTVPSLSQSSLGFEWSVTAVVHLLRFVQMAWLFFQKWDSC